ncbi:hypothetical protein Pcinc_024162 [Petrolisthes cinctipes]|uniref:Protein FAM107B n=1 Tax=Petrolisthes cinctipes TaxID=88211 RepID=A0AAE1KDD9_PETCI|nr:hypothetical protein Pcinc_038916 [Petrolisthes cinctipes]KAK3870624.1 hypothetical protein Pcinc_024162 [Petrolisthes cinctipes]
MPLKKYIRAPVEEVPSIKGKLAFFEQQGREVVYGAMIPEPDYSDDETTTTTTTVKQPMVAALVARNNKNNTTEESNNKDDDKSSLDGGVKTDQNGLIVPKKLVNPCLESSDKKNLHRELLFNQKRGMNVLNQKTELQKAMEKHKDKKVMKEQEMEKTASKTPFQKALDERAHKIEQMEKTENKETENGNSACEFQKIHAKVRAKMEV